MSRLHIWMGLAVAVLATMLSRGSGPLIARSSLLKKINEETLSRLFPMVILFCLVFKEVAATFSLGHVQPPLIETLSIVAVVALHVWRRSLFLSILGGTAIHALLLAFIAR